MADNLKVLLEHHFEIDDSEKDTHGKRNIRNFQQSKLGKNDKLLCISEIKRTTRKINKEKAPSPDGLQIQIITQLFISNKNLFQYI